MKNTAFGRFFIGQEIGILWFVIRGKLHEKSIIGRDSRPNFIFICVLLCQMRKQSLKMLIKVILK